MSNIPTPHITAQAGDFAETVLMPGDPLRAKFIAETLLDKAVLINPVRGINGYTGYFQGKRISVMASGMGMPSIGIYSYELYHFYDVKNIIRVGSAGAIHPSLKIGDIVLAMSTCTNSSYAAQYVLPGSFAPTADFGLLEKAVAQARRMKLSYQVGSIFSSDTFYDDSNSLKVWQKMGVLAIEMEAAALYMNAARCGKKALCICTISDCPFTGEALSAEERQLSFSQMINLALNITE